MINRLHPRRNNLTVLFFCFVFLAIQMSGAHAHRFFESPATPTESNQVLIHVELGLVHFDAHHSHEHDHQDDHHANEGLTDVKLEMRADGPSTPLKLSQMQFAVLVTALLWEVKLEPSRAISRDLPPERRPPPTRLRPPSCGPPDLFIV